MNKEEILEKARKNHKKELDEREISVQEKGESLSHLFMLLGCFILMVLKMNAHQPYQDVYFIAGIGMTVSYLYQGFKLHKKKDILLGIGWLLITLGLLYTYCQNILG